MKKEKLKEIGKVAVEKAIEAAKKEITPDKVVNIATDIVKGDKAAAKRKLRADAKKIAKTVAADKAVHADIRDTVKQLSDDPNVRKVLEKKGKEILDRESRALVSNIIAGSGMKMMKR